MVCRVSLHAGVQRDDLAAPTARPRFNVLQQSLSEAQAPIGFLDHDTANFGA